MVEIPPPELRRLIGDGDSEEEFVRVGSGIAGMMASLGLLERGCRLLDVGCGCGRVAYFLRDSPIGSYAGFDRNPDLVAWAEAHLGAADPRFRFLHVSVASPYELLDGHRGSSSAQALRFPFPDAEFDLALASSVFTHMPSDDVDAYLRELRRVVAPRGRVLASWFLSDDPGGSVEGLGFAHDRALHLERVRASGFEARALWPAAPRSGRESRPPQHEWFLLGDLES